MKVVPVKQWPLVVDYTALKWPTLHVRPHFAFDCLAAMVFSLPPPVWMSGWQVFQ